MHRDTLKNNWLKTYLNKTDESNTIFCVQNKIVYQTIFACKPPALPYENTTIILFEYYTNLLCIVKMPNILSNKFFTHIPYIIKV